MIWKIKIFSDFYKLKNFLQKGKIGLRFIIFSSIFSVFSGFLEGIGIIFLFPLLKGIFEKDFSFVKEWGVLKNFAIKIPQFFSSNTYIFIFLVTIVFIFTVASILIRYFASVLFSYQVRKFIDNLRRFIFKRYLSFGKLFFDRANLGYLHNILVGFTGQVANTFKNLHSVFNQFFLLLIYLSIMFFIEFRLAILIIVMLPILNYIFKWLIIKTKKTSYIFVSSLKKINEKIFNVLSCIPLVKLYSYEKKEEKEFSNLSEELCKIEFSLDKKNIFFVPFQEIVMLAMIILIVSVISFIVVKEKKTELQNFLIFFYLFKKVTNNLNFFNILKNSLASISGPIEEITKIFDNKDKFFVMEGKKEFVGLNNGIEIKNLSFSYIEGIKVLDNLTLFIPKGKITALVGPTGAGKTTIISLILRFYDCPDSSIFIDGVDIKEFTLESLRRYMALVSQDMWLFNDSIFNNLIYGLDGKISEDQIVDVLKKARLYDFVMKLPDKFNTYIGDRGIRLSGGEKQRLSIARALLKKAEILILDEATSSLDSKTEKLIQEAISEVIRDKTTIVIAHRLSTIKNADKIVVIERGRLVEEGTLEELLSKKSKFYEYWQAQKFY